MNATRAEAGKMSTQSNFRLEVPAPVVVVADGVDEESKALEISFGTTTSLLQRLLLLRSFLNKYRSSKVREGVGR